MIVSFAGWDQAPYAAEQSVPMIQSISIKVNGTEITGTDNRDVHVGDTLSFDFLVTPSPGRQMFNNGFKIFAITNENGTVNKRFVPAMTLVDGGAAHYKTECEIDSNWVRGKWKITTAQFADDSYGGMWSTIDDYHYLDPNRDRYISFNLTDGAENDPPEIVSIELSKNRVCVGDSATVTVRARDASEIDTERCKIKFRGEDRWDGYRNNETIEKDLVYTGKDGKGNYVFTADIGPITEERADYKYAVYYNRDLTRGGITIPDIYGSYDTGQGTEWYRYCFFVPEHGHDWGEWVVTRKPTLLAEGERVRTCKNDTNHVEKETIPKLCAHEEWNDPEYAWTEGDTKVVATHTCKGCGKEETEEAAVTEEVTKEATETEDGEKTLTASFTNAAFGTQSKTVVIPKKGSGADPAPAPSDNRPSAEETEKAVMGAASDEGPAGTAYAPLQLRSTKQTKNSVTLKWNAPAGAVKYIVYGNQCGKGKGFRRIAEVSGRKSLKVTKAAGRKIVKGKYYKFIVVALDKNNKVISTSKSIHVATKGGKVGNHRKVTVKKSVITKAKKLKVGKTLKLNAKQVKASGRLKVKKHRVLKYESSNKAVATVSKKGVVKGRSKGSCYIYAYAQNGVCRKIRINVK